MKRWILAATLAVSSLLVAQSPIAAQAEVSDPAAMLLLQKMEAYLEAHQVIDVEFTISMTFPGEEPVRYDGTFQQQDDQFKIDVKSYQILCDGLTRWVYLPEANEVNIYNAAGIDGPQTPTDFLKVYQSEDFIYAITGAEKFEGSDVQLIEFKPVDRRSEYLKLRLSVRTGDHAPVRIEIFERGGARNDMQIKKIRSAQQRPEAYFAFEIDAHPGIRVEDLRID